MWLVLALFGCGSSDCLMVRVDGADLPVCVEGDLDSPQILLHLAGGPSGTGGWTYTNYGLRPELQKSFAVARYDYRGFGASKGTYSLAKMTMAQLGHDTNEVVRALKIRYPEKEVWLHGHSFGGSLGTATLLDPNSEADGWISEAGCHDSVLAGTTSQERLLAHDPSDLPEEQAARWEEIKGEIVDLDPADVDGSLGINIAANEVEGFLYFEGPENDIQGGLAFAAGMPFQLLQVGLPGNLGNRALSQDQIALDHAADIAQVEVPALYLAGDLDFICTAELSTHAFETIGSARKDLHIFEDTTHDVGDQRPFEAAEIIEAFVRP